MESLQPLLELVTSSADLETTVTMAHIRGGNDL